MAEKKTPKISAFLAAIRKYPNITAAAKAAGISREAHYRRLEDDEKYRVEFERAYSDGIAAIEDEAIRRAVRGVQRPVLYHGLPVMIPKDPDDPEGGSTPLMETEYSDSLITLLLKAKKPEEYKERIEQKVEVNVNLVDRLNAGRARLAKARDAS